MHFEVEKRFDSLGSAFEFVLDRYALRTPQQLWLSTKDGLSVPHEVSRFLFRGECGCFERTVAGILRRHTYSLNDGRVLSEADRDWLTDVIPALAGRYCNSDYAVEEDSAIGLLQHYGLPTWMIDLTDDVRCAFSFAVAGPCEIGRIAVVPLSAFPYTRGLVNLTEHK